MEIGVQFYTLRDKAQNLNDFSESLARVADIGYKTVQISGVCEFEPEWLKSELDKNGLKCVLTHWGYDEIKNEPLKAIEAHKIFGCNYIGLGSMPGGVKEENLENFVNDYKNSANILKENGFKLFYHNHHWEFSRCKDGELIFDKILKSFSPDELGITFDTYWAQYGGACPSLWLKKLRGRIECIHLKDMEIVGDEQRMAPVGYGNINFEKVVSSAEYAGAKYLLVEQDNCYGKDPFECLKMSYEYLKSIGLK